MSRLFERLTRRVQQTAERRQRALARTVAEKLVEQVSGIVATAERDRVIISGRSLHRRWLEDGQLRFLGELVR